MSEVKSRKNRKKKFVSVPKYESSEFRGYSSFGRMVLSNKMTEPSYKIGRALREHNTVGKLNDFIISHTF
jgi:hypothetical protein